MCVCVCDIDDILRYIFHISFNVLSTFSILRILGQPGSIRKQDSDTGQLQSSYSEDNLRFGGGKATNNNNTTIRKLSLLYYYKVHNDSKAKSEAISDTYRVNK